MDNHQAIRDMINNISMGNASEVQTNFNAIMQAKAGDSDRIIALKTILAHCPERSAIYQ